MTTIPSNTLGKWERLKSRKKTEQLFKEGKAVKVPSLVVVYRMYQEEQPFPCQALFTVSKRLYKRAHDRNRIKRLLREAYRKQKNTLYSAATQQSLHMDLALQFTGKQLPNYPYVYGKLAEVIKQLEKIIHETTL
jgi:ribonuclease P protein component